MNYIICAYSIILMFSAYFGYKKKLGVSVVSILINLCLCTSTIVTKTLFNLFYSINYLKLLISIFLILLSVSLLYDRKISGNKINYSHHCIRFIIHVLIICYLFL